MGKNYVLDLIIQAENKATEELNKIGTDVQALQSRMGTMSKATTDALKKVWVASTAVAVSVGALAKSFIDASIENEPIQKSFERLSESANIASEEMLNAMRKASRGTVSDTKLMASANKAYALGIVQTADDMATMMEIARVKGQAMGRTMEEALDDIVTWLGRGSAQILDNLGIVVNSQEAYNEYAKSIGKATSELTEAEKKQALVNKVVSQGKKELADAWEVALTMAERQAQLNASWENIQNTIGDALVPVLEKVLDIVQPLIDKFAQRATEHPKLLANILLVVGGVASLLAVFSGLALALPTIITTIGTVGSVIWALSWPIGRAIGAVALLATAWANNWGGIQDTTKNVCSTIYDEYLEPLITKAKELWDNYGMYVIAIIQAIADTIGIVLNTILALIGGTIETACQVVKIGIDLITWNWDKALEDIIGLVDIFDNTLRNIFGECWDNIKAWVVALYDSIISILTSLTDKVRSIVGSLRNAWESAKEAAKDSVSSAVNKVTSLFQSKKAGGGVVTGGETYLVWENGPELFTPSQSGKITPNNQITNNNGIEINISGVSVRSDNDIELITDEIIRKIKLEKQFWIA